MLEAFIRAVDQAQGQPWALPLFLLVFALACQGLPTGPFPVVGGILFGFWGGIAANVAGFTLGAALTFALTRRWGRGIFARFVKARAWPDMLERPTFALFAIVRLTGFPPLLAANILAGLSKMPWGTFLAATAVGVLPWSTLMTFFADVLWEALRSGGFAGFKRTLWIYAKPATLAIAAFAALVGAAAWFGRRLLPPPQAGGSVKE